MSKFAIRFILGVTALGLAGGALATAVSNKNASKGDAPNKCFLQVENKTDAPITVGVSNGGPSVTVSAGAKNLLTTSCDVLAKTSENSSYNRLVRKQSNTNYAMTLTAKSGTTTKATGASKTPPSAAGSQGGKQPAAASSSKTETYKLDAGMSQHIWFTTNQQICLVPGC
jgi:hypothetical protein